jgi:hypothetical protein
MTLRTQNTSLTVAETALSPISVRISLCFSAEKKMNADLNRFGASGAFFNLEEDCFAVDGFFECAFEAFFVSTFKVVSLQDPFCRRVSPADEIGYSECGVRRSSENGSFIEETSALASSSEIKESMMI